MPYNQLDEYANAKDVLFEWDARGWSKRRHLPNDPAAEANLLASMILNPEALEAVKNLNPEDLFFTPANRIVFQGIVQMPSLDLESAFDYFADQGQLEEVGGELELFRIWNQFPRYADICSANYPYYLNILEDCHQRREGIRESLNLQKELFDGRADPEKSVKAYVAKIHRTFNLGEKPVGPGLKVE